MKALTLKQYALLLTIIILVPLCAAQYFLSYRFTQSLNEDYVKGSISNLTELAKTALLYPMATNDSKEIKRFADGIAQRKEVYAIEVTDIHGNILYRSENGTIDTKNGISIEKYSIDIIDPRDKIQIDDLDFSDAGDISYGRVAIDVLPLALSDEVNQLNFNRWVLFTGLLIIVSVIVYLLSLTIRKEVFTIFEDLKNLENGKLVVPRNEPRQQNLWAVFGSGKLPIV